MIFDRFFKPYAEYCLRTTLSEDELKTSLDKELPGYFIASVKAVFGKEKVRAWTGGIPQVFGECTEMDVKKLFYPDFVEWKNTRLEI